MDYNQTFSQLYSKAIIIILLLISTTSLAQETYDSFDAVAKEISKEIDKKLSKNEDIKILVPNFINIDKVATPLGIQLATDFTGYLTRHKKNFEVINPAIGEVAVREQMRYFILKDESTELKQLLEKFHAQYLIYAQFTFVESEDVIEFPSGVIVNGIALTGDATTLCSSEPFRLKLDADIAKIYKSLNYSIVDLGKGDSLLDLAKSCIKTNPSRALDIFLSAHNQYKGVGDYSIVEQRNEYLKKELRQFLDNIVLNKVLNGDIIGIQSEPLAKPLVVKATLYGKPVGNLKIKFKFSKGTGVIDTLTRTNEIGEAKAMIHKLYSAGRIVISASVDTVLDLYPKISPLQFNILVRKKRADLNVFVSIEINNMGSKSDGSNAIITKLKNVGFVNCYRDSNGTVFDVKITGNINAWCASQISGIYCASASGTISAYDAENQLILTESASVAKEFANNKTSAGSAAIAKVKNKLLHKLINKLTEIYSK